MEMLDDGQLPDFLEKNENEIIFRLDVRQGDDGTMLVSAQSRHAPDQDALQRMLDHLISGEPMDSHDPLYGQLERFRAIMRTHFPRHLQEGNFKDISQQ